MTQLKIENYLKNGEFSDLLPNDGMYYQSLKINLKPIFRSFKFNECKSMIYIRGNKWWQMARTEFYYPVVEVFWDDSLHNNCMIQFIYDSMYNYTCYRVAIIRHPNGFVNRSSPEAIQMHKYDDARKLAIHYVDRGNLDMKIPSLIEIEHTI